VGAIGKDRVRLRQRRTEFQTDNELAAPPYAMPNRSRTCEVGAIGSQKDVAAGRKAFRSLNPNPGPRNFDTPAFAELEVAARVLPAQPDSDRTRDAVAAP